MNLVIPMLGLTAHGGNRVLVAVANALVQSGHQCRVLAPGQVPAMPFKFDPRVEVEFAGPQVANKALRWLLFSAYLAVALRGRDVIANHFVTAVAARIAQLTSSARVVYLVQDIEYRFYRGILRSVARWLCLWSYRLPLLLPANGYLEKELQRHGVRPLPALRLGVAAAFFSEPPAAGAKSFDVVYFLRREPHKRIDRFQAIARLLLDSGVTIAGISQDEALIKECAPSLTAAFRPADDHALIAVLDQARLLLLTSEQEGFALPPLEAMARGLPAVMFPCGGPGEYARDGYNCVMVGDESTDTAAREILRLLRDGPCYGRLSANARATAADFDFAPGLAALIPRLENMLPERRLQ